MLAATAFQQNSNDMGNRQSETAIEHLVETIGLVDACELIRSTRHLMIERHSQLSTALQQNDVMTSKRCAHRTIGSIRLYGSQRLEELLFQVGNKPLKEINTVAFQQELSAEFASAISTVNAWLELNCDKN